MALQASTDSEDALARVCCAPSRFSGSAGTWLVQGFTDRGFHSEDVLFVPHQRQLDFVLLFDVVHAISTT